MALAQRTSRSPRRRSPVVVPHDRESGVRLRGARPVAGDPEDLRAFAAAAEAAAQGLAVCARRARSREIAEQSALLGEAMRTAAERAKELVPGGVRRPTTSERLRWEWLASTGSLLDGGAERRLAGELARHLTIASEAAARLDPDDPARLEAAERVHEAASFCRALVEDEDPLRAPAVSGLARR